MKNIFSLIALLMSMSTVINAQNYQNAESAEYDPTQNRWLVSNGSNILARASNGTLSFFGTGSAGFGTEVLGNTVFAIDGTMIKGFDLTTEQEVMRITIPGAGFLNGLTNDGTSTLYATDFSNSDIHKIDVSNFDNPSSERIVSNTMTTPNGIIYDGNNNRLLFTSWSGANAPISQVDLSDFSVSTVINTNVGRIDGIDDDANGNYYISSWSPARITKYDNSFANPEIITAPGISNPADIGYSKQTDTLAIPIGSNVIFVGFEVVSSTNNIDTDELEFQVYPNPINEQSIIDFTLAKAEELELNILTINGQLIKSLLSGKQIAGKHRVLLAGLNLPSGIYNCQLKTATQVFTKKIVLAK